MMADHPEPIDFGALDLTQLCLCGHDIGEHPQDVCEHEGCYCVAMRPLQRVEARPSRQ